MEEFLSHISRDHRPLAERCLQALGASKDESKDLVQDGIINLIEHWQIHGFDPENLEQYTRLFYTMCKYRWVDLTRNGNFKNYRLDPTEQSSQPKAPAFDLSDWTVNKAQKFIRKTFLQWNERKGKLLYMRYFLGASVEDLADDFNYSSAGTTRVTCTNARKSFLNWIQKYPEKEELFREALLFFERYQVWEVAFLEQD